MAAWRGFRIWCCECQRINNTSYAQLFLSVLTPNQVITLTKMHFTSFIAMCVCYWGYDRSLRSERFDPRRWWRKNVTIFVWKLFFVVPTPTNWISDYLFFVCRISIYYLITDFNVEFWIISLVNGREWWVFCCVSLLHSLSLIERLAVVGFLFSHCLFQYAHSTTNNNNNNIQQVLDSISDIIWYFWGCYICCFL